MVFTVDCITGPCNSPLRVNYWMVWSELEIWRMFCKADVLAKSQYWQDIHDSICAGMWIEWTCTQPIHFSFTTSESATCHCSLNNSWWRHQMETFSALLAFSSVTGEFLSQRPVTWSFDIFFDLRLNKRLSKPSRRRWFETPSCPLWRQCNVLNIDLVSI